MLRRVYMIFPRADQVARAVSELKAMGVSQHHMHTIAREDIDVSGLPEATVSQRSDKAAELERILWNVNLVLFFSALVVLALGLITGAWGVAVASAALMALCFFLGNHFASHVPHVHLEEFRAVLERGEILLLVDIPRWRILDIESAIERSHPEVSICGSSWTLEALKI